MRWLYNNTEVRRSISAKVLLKEGIITVEEIEFLPTGQPGFLSAFLFRSLIWHKNTLVFSRKGCAETVLQEAGGTHNQRFLTNISQDVL